jgi:HEAT repeat protein
VALLAAAAWVVAATSAVVPAQQPPPAPGDEAQLVAVLQKPDATLFDKAKACQALALIGTQKCVPVLAGLLSDEKLAHYARFGLEPIPDPSVDEALRTALGRLQGRLLVGVIDSIGNRRDPKAVDDLKGLLASSDREVAAAAAAALGRIAAPACIEALGQALGGPANLRPAVGDACLAACDRLLAAGKRDEAAVLYDAVRRADVPKYVRIAAAHGAIRARGPAAMPQLVEYLGSDDKGLFGVALAAAHELPAKEVAPALVVEFSKLKPGPETTPKILAMISVMADVGDPAALPVVLRAAKEGAPDIRLAAIRALARLGNASAAPLLMETIAQAQDELAEAARDSLAELKGREIDDAIAAALDRTEWKARVFFIELAGERGIKSAAPALLKAADDPDLKIRLAAIRALGTTVGLDDLSAVIAKLLAATSKEETAALKDALGKACLRAPDREAAAEKVLSAMREASVASKCLLVETLGQIGGATALKAVSASARDADARIQDAATRVLGAWLSPDAAPTLLELAKSGEGNKFQIRALRGYIRIARQLGLPADQRLAMCREAFALAQRDEEKRLVLEVLGRIPSAEALAMVLPHLKSPGLKAAASTAAVSIGEKIVGTSPAAVAKAVQQVLKSGPDSKLENRAKVLADRAAKTPK